MMTISDRGDLVNLTVTVRTRGLAHLLISWYISYIRITFILERGEYAFFDHDGHYHFDSRRPSLFRSSPG